MTGRCEGCGKLVEDKDESRFALLAGLPGSKPWSFTVCVECLWKVLSQLDSEHVNWLKDQNFPSLALAWSMNDRRD